MSRLNTTRPTQNFVPEGEKTIKLEFHITEELDSWKTSESSTIEWRRRDGKIGTRKPEGSRGWPVTVEWTRIYKCPFYGHEGAYQRHVKNRVNTKDSSKVGYQASIRVRKEFDDDKISVTYTKEHTRHLNSAEGWKKQRLPPVLMTWLQEVVA